MGHDPVGADPANYYTEKVTQKFRTYGSGEDSFRLVTERVVNEVVNLKTQKFTNAQFIQELIDRGLVPADSAAGYKLVLIEAADRMDDDHDLPLLFFIENSAGEIHYVGRQAWEATTERDALVLDFGYSYAESYNFRERTVFKHVSTSEGVEEDYDGVTTYSETFRGTDTVSVALFPGYYDEVFDEFVSTEGVTFEFEGHLNYNGRYDAKNDQFLLSSAKISNAPGGFESESDEEDYISGVASLNLSVAGSRPLADITPYLEALPEELTGVKQEFLDHYDGVSVE